VMVSVFDPEFRVLHARTPFDRDYMRKRLDVAWDQKILRLKYYAQAHLEARRHPEGGATGPGTSGEGDRV
jgi:hypothetical protein